MPIYERMTVKGRAGALQPYQSSQNAVAPGVTSARVSDAAAGIYARGASMANEGMGRFAAAVGKAGHTFLDAYEDYSKTKATELFNKYREGMNQAMDGENGIMSQVGEGAFHAGQQTMGTSHGLRADLLKDYGEGSRVAQIFDQLADPQENAYHVRAQQHGEKEYKLWQDRTDDAAAKGYFDEALANYADPDKFARGMAGALYHVEQQLVRKGYSGDALDRGMLEASSKVYKAGIEAALAQDDFAGAERMLGEGSVRMTEADRLAMRGKVRQGYFASMDKQAGILAKAGDVEGVKRIIGQGAPIVSATGLNAGIAAQVAQWGGGKVKYFRDDTGKSVRDPRTGGIDCSGWVGWTLEKCGVKGFRGLHAEGQIDEAWARGAGNIPQEEILANPRENMLIGIDTGPKPWDKGRKKGIDHIAVTFRDPQTGRLMISESSGSRGVRQIPWEQWLSERGNKTKAFYGADLSTIRGRRRPYSDLALNEANNNPGNISGSGGVGNGYKAYGTTLEGFQALDQLIRTSYRGMTPAQLAEKYAPANDPRGRNDPVGYAIQIARDLGMIPEDYMDRAAKALKGDREARGEMMQFIDGDAKIDVDSREVRARLMKSIAQREGPTRRFNLDEADYAAGVKQIPEGYQSKDLRKESRDRPGDAEAADNGLADMPPEMAAKMSMHLETAKANREKNAVKQRQDAVITEFSQDPKAGLALLATKEGRARYGMGAKEAADTMSLLNTLWTQQKNMEKSAREEHERTVYTDAVNLALGVGGEQADPVAAYRIVASDSDLDGQSKLQILNAISNGILDRDDPAYVADIKTKIAREEHVPDSELARAMAAGQLSSKTKEQILKLRDLVSGPQKEIIKSAFNAINDAFKKSLMADGTPEQANAHYAAIFELQAVMEQAQKDGTVMQLLDPNSPKYVLPGIIQRHTLTMKQQVEAVAKKAGGNTDGTAPPENKAMRKPGETIEEYKARMNGGGKR